MKKIIKVGFIKVLWMFAGLGMFLHGILAHDWYFLIGGFLFMFEDIEVVHYQGKEYENE